MLICYLSSQRWLLEKPVQATGLFTLYMTSYYKGVRSRSLVVPCHLLMTAEDHGDRDLPRLSQVTQGRVFVWLLILMVTQLQLVSVSFYPLLLPCTVHTVIPPSFYYPCLISRSLAPTDCTLRSVRYGDKVLHLTGQAGSLKSASQTLGK